MLLASSGDLFFWSLVGIIAGIGTFVWGFFQLRKKRIIENIPTSKIRSMAIGLVEVKGQAIQHETLIAPFTNAPCVYYQYKVEELRRNRRSTYWACIHKGDTATLPFFIQDDTSRVLIQPEGAEVETPTDFTLQTGILKDIPDHIVSFLDSRQVKYRGFLGFSKTLRFTECHFAPGDTLYVIGVCKNNRGNLMSKHRQRLQDAIKKVKAHPEVMKQFDLNQDGQISPEEWEIARQLIDQKLSEKFPDENELKVFIGKGENRTQMFLITDRSEKDMVSQLSVNAGLGVWGGSAMTIASLWYILHVVFSAPGF